MPIWNQARAVVLALAIASTCAFAPQPKTYRYSPLFAETKSPPAVPAPLDKAYGEESRKYRRTVYSHDDWVKHRSPDRFIRNLVKMPSSGVYKNLGRELMAVTAVGAFCILFNMLTGDYTDFGGIKHAGIWKDTLVPLLKLPLTPFTLLSPSLGLLLGK
jgi:putative membrane protein